MSRIARIVIADYPHHIIQRGHNRRQVVFVGAGGEWEEKDWGQVLQYNKSNANIVAWQDH